MSYLKSALPAATITTVASSGATQTLALPTLGDAAFDITLTANCTFSVAGGTAGKLQNIVVALRQDATAGHSITLPAAVAWPSQVAPSFNLAAGRYDILQLSTFDGGTTFAGSLIASAVTPFSVPQAPGTLAYISASGTNVISWADNGNGGSSITTHNIYRGSSSGSEALLTTSATSPFTDTGRTNGVLDYYKVSAVNSLGESALSAEVVASAGHYFNPGSTGYTTTASAASFMPGASAVVDLRGLVQMPNWVPSGNSFIVAKWGSSGSQSYAMYIDNAGKLNFLGVTTAFVGSPSTSALPFTAGSTHWMRAVADTGAGTITYYTSPDASQNWTQLGTTISFTAGTLTAGSTPPPVTIAASATPNSYLATGRVYRAQIIIGGTTVFDADFRAQTAGAASFTETAGNTVTINSPGSII